uniref:PIN domain-containing protein n=1 Tax=Treponema sp. TaxID=166 RepID=UPI00257ED730
MNKVFVDTDVILDLLAGRLPNFHFSAVLFTFAEMKKLELYTTPLILANTFYILRKQLGNDSAKMQSENCVFFWRKYNLLSLSCHAPIVTINHKIPALVNIFP